MSYDVSLYADLGGPDPVPVGNLDANYTWNVAPMFVEACGTTPQAWDGKPASEVADIVTGVITAFNSDPGKFKKLNPENGWGDFEGARQFAQTILDACREAPQAIVRVS